MAKAIHSMIRVLEEARSVAFYERAFGLRIADRLDFPTFTLVYLRNDEVDFEIELTVNKGRTEPYALGDGYGHIAFCVDDLDAERARFEALGLAPLPSSTSGTKASSWPASSSSRIPTATRSRCCRSTDATARASRLCRPHQNERQRRRSLEDNAHERRPSRRSRPPSSRP